MNRPWPEVMSLLATIMQWQALRDKGPWATTKNLSMKDVWNTAPLHGDHPWQRPMK